MTSTGYGDILPTSSDERLVGVLTMLVGTVCTISYAVLHNPLSLGPRFLPGPLGCPNSSPCSLTLSPASFLHPLLPHSPASSLLPRSPTSLLSCPLPLSSLMHCFTLFRHTQVGLGLFMAIVAARKALADAPQVDFRERLQDVRRFLTEHGVSNTTVVQATRHLQCRWALDTASEPWEAYARLPASVQHDVLPTAGAVLLSSCPLFLGLTAPASALLCTRLRRTLALRATVIMHAGDVSHDMYFIEAGAVELRRPDGVPFLRLGPGAYFGCVDMALGARRHCAAIALSDCRLLLLTRDDLREASVTSSTFACKLQALESQKGLLPAMAAAMADVPRLDCLPTETQTLEEEAASMQHGLAAWVCSVRTGRGAETQDIAMLHLSCLAASSHTITLFCLDRYRKQNQSQAHTLLRDPLP